MKKYEGMKWNELSDSEKEKMLYSASAIDATTGEEPKSSMECIIDFSYGLSIAGNFIRGDEENTIEINDESVLYNPEN